MLGAVFLAIDLSHIGDWWQHNQSKQIIDTKIKTYLLAWMQARAWAYDVKDTTCRKWKKKLILLLPYVICPLISPFVFSRWSSDSGKRSVVAAGRLMHVTTVHELLCVAKIDGSWDSGLTSRCTNLVLASSLFYIYRHHPHVLGRSGSYAGIRSEYVLVAEMGAILAARARMPLLRSRSLHLARPTRGSRALRERRARAAFAEACMEV